MARKPYKKARSEDSQRGVYQCQNCKEIFLDSPKGINDKDFCSEQCKKAYEARQQRKNSYNGDTIANKEDILQ